MFDTCTYCVFTLYGRVGCVDHIKNSLVIVYICCLGSFFFTGSQVIRDIVPVTYKRGSVTACRHLVGNTFSE